MKSMFDVSVVKETLKFLCSLSHCCQRMYANVTESSVAAFSQQMLLSILNCVCMPGKEI